MVSRTPYTRPQTRALCLRGIHLQPPHCTTLVVMGDYKFCGVDPIRVISFLALCKDNFHNANMTEAMALMALPHLLSPPAK